MLFLKALYAVVLPKFEYKLVHCFYINILLEFVSIADAVKICKHILMDIQTDT